MELWTETEWYVQALFNVLLFLIPTLATVAASSVFGAAMINAIKRIYAEIVRPAIDQPTDPVITLIAQRTGRDATAASKWLVENLDAVIAVLPEEAQPSGG